MPETILSRSIRGLGNALGLTGEKTGPPGIDLDLPAQTVSDITAYARYGSARLSDRGDGWVQFAVTMPHVAAGFVVTTQTVSAALDARIRNGDIFWVYGITLDVSVSTDYVGATILGGHTTVLQIGSLLPAGATLWTGKDFIVTSAAAAAQCVPSEIARFPYPMEEGSAFVFISESNGVVAFSVLTSILGRILPAGVPPLP